jgi:hypothetical protein
MSNERDVSVGRDNANRSEHGLRLVNEGPRNGRDGNLPRSTPGCYMVGPEVRDNLHPFVETICEGSPKTPFCENRLERKTTRIYSEKKPSNEPVNVVVEEADKGLGLNTSPTPSSGYSDEQSPSSDSLRSSSHVISGSSTSSDDRTRSSSMRGDDIRAKSRGFQFDQSMGCNYMTGNKNGYNYYVGTQVALHIAGRLVASGKVAEVNPKCKVGDARIRKNHISVAVEVVYPGHHTSWSIPIPNTQEGIFKVDQMKDRKLIWDTTDVVPNDYHHLTLAPYPACQCFVGKDSEDGQVDEEAEAELNSEEPKESQELEVVLSLEET